jgi:hypothetical protein
VVLQAYRARLALLMEEQTNNLLSRDVAWAQEESVRPQDAEILFLGSSTAT